MTSRAAATRYARALFDVARKEGDVQQAGRDFAGFAGLVAGHDSLANFTNPAIPAPKRGRRRPAPRACRIDVADRRQTSTPAGRARSTRLAAGDCDRHEYRADRAKVVRANRDRGRAAGDRVAALQQGLAHATGRQVQLESRIDPSIIGGAIAKVGSTVYDGSVTRQLEMMRETLAKG